MKTPFIIELQSHDSAIGNLSILEVEKHISFPIKRVFFLTEIYDNVVRGNHAHKKTEQVLFCLKGEINFYAEMPDGRKYHEKLKPSNKGVYIPANAWHYMEYKRHTVQVVCASELYSESDYLRDKKAFYSYYKEI